MADPTPRVPKSIVRFLRRYVTAVVAVGLTTLGLAAAATLASADPTTPAAGELVPIAPAGLVDTTSGVGWSGKLAPDTAKSVTASGTLGVPTTGVLAVLVHITTSDTSRAGATANGNVWAWPTGSARPRYAVVANPPAGSVADNSAIVSVGKAGAISFYNGRSGTAVDVTVDIDGYVTADGAAAVGATFAPITPSRIIDTSNGTGGRAAPLTPSAPWTFQLLGVGGLPASGVSAVALNVGARGAGAQCWVQVQPAGTATTNTSYPRVHTYDGYAAQGLAVVAPDSVGGVTFSTNCSATDLYVDVEGYYLSAANGSAGEVYVPIINPSRVIDTRRNLGIRGKMTAGRVVAGSQAITVRGVGNVPARAKAVALSIGTINGTARGYNTIWTDGTARPTRTSTVNVDPDLVESNLMFVETGPHGKIDVAAASTDRTESNDLYVDIEGYFVPPLPARSTQFLTPNYFPAVRGDTYFNTVGTDGGIVATSNDSRGVDGACTRVGGDIVILHASGANAAALIPTTVNCMPSFGPGGGGDSPDRCSWKSGGITRIGQAIYLAVARQLRQCSRDSQANGLQPSFNASVMKSLDGGKTWTNPWGRTSSDGAAPPWMGKLNRYRAMFPGQSFSAPFFIQYGPGNTRTVDGADKYLYAVSNDGYAYNGNYLHLARVPLKKIQTASAWQYYHGTIGGGGKYWTNSSAGATRVLSVPHGLSQPAIQYVPALKTYVLVTFTYPRAKGDFPTKAETPYTRVRIYTAPKPWGPWTRTFDHSSQRSLWCSSYPCHLTQQPGPTTVTVGTPDDWLGLYDPALVQKFVFTRRLTRQTLFVSGDFKNPTRYTGEHLYRLHAIPFNLSSVLRT